MADGLVEAQETLAELERLGDEEGAVWALRLIGALTGWLGNNAEAQVHWRNAVERADYADNRFVSDVLGWMLLGAWWGPTPVPEVARLADEALTTGSFKRLEGYARMVRGAAAGAVGRLEEGREDTAAGKALLRDLGDLISWAGITGIEADMELAAGDAERAYRALAEGAEVLASSSETGYLATVLSMQAGAALELGREDEAMRLTDKARELATVDDVDPIARDCIVRARVAARHGDFAGAGELIAAARELIEPTDFTNLHFDLAFTRAEIARLAGHADEEREALAEVLALAEAKGHTVLAERGRAELAAMDDGGDR